MIIALVVLAWVVMSVAAFGIYLPEQKRDYGYFNPFPAYFWLSVIGPVSLMTALWTHEGKWGFDLRPYTRDERWQIFDAMYNTDGFILKTREQFDKEY